MQIETCGNAAREIGNAGVELQHINVQIQAHAEHWVNRIKESPNEFRNAEEETVKLFLQLGGVFAAAILVSATVQPEFVQQINPARENYRTKLAGPRKQTIMIRFICGLLFRITTIYCPPAKKKPGEENSGTEFRKGFSPEQALLGFPFKCTPGLEEQVARAVALYPSIKIAQQELQRKGIKIDVKEIRRIAMQCGSGLLSLRYLIVQQMLAGELEDGTILHKKSVVVELDGGRVRTRKNKARKKGAKKKKGQRPKFDTAWREPKVMVIYTVDNNGRKEKDSQIWIDGTFQQANHACDLVVAHLRRLGVSGAKSVTFIADGATWIWDRIDDIVRYAGIPKGIVECVLDFYHASQHVSKALKLTETDEKEFHPLYRELRGELRASRWQIVVDRLKELGKSIEEKSTFWTEIRYLENHGKSGRLSYVKFTRRGLPLGSGTVESTIRRVVNLRMKSNGTFWNLENAERMLQLRCQIMSTEWDGSLDRLYSHRLRGGDENCDWDSPKERYRTSSTESESAEQP